jgi:cell division topological specificity factor
MNSFLNRLLGKSPTSASAAKERLKLVLIHDRTNLSPESLESLKDELIHVISRYVEINPNAVQINMEQNGREQRLIADIPILQANRRRSRSS